jgi:hypothetical protein
MDTYSSETKYLKSLGNYTREALPKIAYYTNSTTIHDHLIRPTLDELHGVQATLMPHKVRHSLVGKSSPK